VLHFRKLDQQRKVPKENEASRSTKYNKSRESTMSFDDVTKQIHSTDSDGCGPLENWEKHFGPPEPENRNISFDTRKDYHHPRGGYTSYGRGRGRTQDRPLYCMYHERDTDHRTRDCPNFLESKKKITQKQSQASDPPQPKKLATHPIGNNHHSHLPHINHPTTHPNTPTHVLSTNHTSIDTVTPSFKAKPNAHSMCVQESSLHTYYIKMDT
jgi:hypothetical protein